MVKTDIKMVETMMDKIDTKIIEIIMIIKIDSKMEETIMVKDLIMEMVKEIIISIEMIEDHLMKKV